MVNPHFRQQELEEKNSLIPITVNTSVGLEVLSGFARIRGTVGKDNYIKRLYLFIYFFHIFVLVIQYLDVNQFYMQLTVDNMDGTEAGSMTNRIFFFTGRYVL